MRRKKMREIKTLAFPEFAALYCERQEATPDELRDVLLNRVERFNPEGFILLECAMFDSSRLGEMTILPYGGGSTFKTVPTGPVSPRGLCSDMSTVVAVLPVKELKA
jgi:hypothetical protein